VVGTSFIEFSSFAREQKEEEKAVEQAEEEEEHTHAHTATHTTQIQVGNQHYH